MSGVISDVPPEVETRIWSLFDEYLAGLHEGSADALRVARAEEVVSARPREDPDGTRWVDVNVTTAEGGLEPVFEVRADVLFEGL